MTIETQADAARGSADLHEAYLDDRRARAGRRRDEALRRLVGHPFTAETGMRLGLTRDDLRSSAVRRVGHGVFVDSRTPSSLALRTAAVLLTAPADAHAAAFTAARLQGLPVPATDRVHVSIPPGTRWRNADAVVLRHEAPRAFVAETSAGPLAMTMPMDLLEEVVDRATLVDAVVLADAVLARHEALAEDIVAGWVPIGCCVGSRD